MSKLTMDRVRGLELFSGCRRAQLQAIDRLGCKVDFSPDTVLCREGGPGREFFVLASGTVRVDVHGGEVAVLHPGAWFGEIALLRAVRRQASVTTSSHATVLVFDTSEFTSLLATAPGVRDQLEHSAHLVEQAGRPTLRTWYQPLR